VNAGLGLKHSPIFHGRAVKGMLKQKLKTLIFAHFLLETFDPFNIHMDSVNKGVQMTYWLKKIHDLMKEMDCPEVDPAEVEDFLIASHETLSTLEKDQLCKEIKMAVFSIHSGLLDETIHNCKNYYGNDVGCEVPPGRTPPEFCPDFTVEDIQKALKSN
jgi:hypothetical protein